MRSSSTSGQLIAVIALAAACSTPQPAVTGSSDNASPDCVGAPVSLDAQAITALRETVEKGPFYGIAARAGVAGCRAARDDGTIRLEYTFRDGASLRVARNEEIEYTDQDLRLASPLDESPVAALTRAEQAAFDGRGCGIDWRSIETRTPDDDPDATESIYRGDVCSCQARARSDAAGRVIRLQFRSAC